jgi:hypothetical protein
LDSRGFKLILKPNLFKEFNPGIKNGARIRETLKKRYASRELPVTPKQLDATQ